ncbi:uncharacterized protein EAF02_009362 [Botrytis sinoallii]|uniref:uncharacterized protein n=1 Tax=Botrytis sinoallii TaxID=1463999 RepID=UPI0018FFB36A|nr:uncharacterized protein EAF02_009362 [Botrytis sinoallii]KAF7870172.1 hypothetical protein EAF02_009362 [Botrytis sinoallii]
MAYAHDLCSVGTGPGRYGTSVDSSTAFIAIPSVLPSVYCPACCFGMIWKYLFSNESRAIISPEKNLIFVFLAIEILCLERRSTGTTHRSSRTSITPTTNGKISFRDEAPSTIHMAYVFCEAYMVVMEEYKQIFDGSVGLISQIWFDFDIDTLYFDGGPIAKRSQVDMNSVSWSSDFQKVKHLAIFSYSVETHGFPHHIRNFSMRDFAFRDSLY